VPEEAGRVRDAVRAAGGTAVDVTAAGDAGVDAAIAVGTEALVDAGERDRPVLLVGEGIDGLPSIAPADLETAVEALIDRDGEAPTVALPRLSVRTRDVDVTATLDVTLQSVEPARISEFDVGVAPAPPASSLPSPPGDAGGEGPVDRLVRLRADGVVLATPAGSHGYPRAAGGPRAVGGRVAVVVPIAPFAVGPDTWVVPLAERRVRVTVERDEATVGLFVDGREVTEVAHHTPVVVGHEEDVRLVDGRRLEKH